MTKLYFSDQAPNKRGASWRTLPNQSWFQRYHWCYKPGCPSVPTGKWNNVSQVFNNISTMLAPKSGLTKDHQWERELFTCNNYMSIFIFQISIVVFLVLAAVGLFAKEHKSSSHHTKSYKLIKYINIMKRLECIIPKLHVVHGNAHKVSIDRTTLHVSIIIRFVGPFLYCCHIYLSLMELPREHGIY